MPDKKTALSAAGFFPRAAAWLLDRLILAAILLLPRLSAALGSGGVYSRYVLFRHTLLDVLCWAAAAVYFVLFTCFAGATPGKKAMHLRVVDVNGGAPTLLTVLYRETIGRYLSSLLCLGYLMTAIDPEKRALHDMICDTRVVYADSQKAERSLTVVQTDDPVRDWYKPYRT